MKFTAMTNAGPFDIGEFSTIEDARSWAEARFGEDLLDVAPQLETSVTVTAEPPTNWLLWAGVALAAYFMFKPGKGGLI